MTISRLLLETLTPKLETTMRRRCTAEAIGTFALVFAGAGAIVINDVAGGAIGHVGIALTFGLVVMAMIYSIGDVSGAHINPAVTLGFWMARRLHAGTVAPYIASQLLGALVAAGLLRLLFLDHPTLGLTAPAGPEHQAFILEVVITWLLMFAILCVATGSKEQGLMAGITIGGVVGLCAMFAGPISGASLNPARSIGPALVALDLAHLWISVLAPPIGAALAVPAWLAVRPARRPAPLAAEPPRPERL